MGNPRLWLYLLIGLVSGGVIAALFANQDNQAEAATDHFQDSILCTGAVSSTFVKGHPFWNAGSQSYHWRYDEVPFEGIWFLDADTARLLGTVVDSAAGKIIGWAEVDLTTEFHFPAGQSPHFMMNTGDVDHGVAALYLAETTSGQLGVYTMAPRSDGGPGVQIQRHDKTPFRNLPK
jgi:hypothetical protein